MVDSRCICAIFGKAIFYKTHIITPGGGGCSIVSLRKRTIKMTTVFFEYTSTFNLGEWSLNSLLKYISTTLFYEVSSSTQGGQCVCITPYFFSWVHWGHLERNPATLFLSSICCPLVKATAESKRLKRHLFPPFSFPRTFSLPKQL